MTCLVERGERQRKDGALKEAILSLQRALEISEAQLGEAHPDTLAVMERMARIHRSLDQFDTAEALYLRALAIRESEEGPLASGTLTLLNRLAGLYRDSARYDEAERLYQRALSGREQTLGADHRYTLAVRFNLAGLYQLQGRYAEAEPLVLNLLETDERLNGPDHPNTLSSLRSAGLLFFLQGRYKEAEPLMLRAIEGYERAFGEDDRRTLGTLNELGLLYRRQARFGEAEPLYLRVAKEREETLGGEHPQTLDVLNNLAVLYKEQGRFTESEARLEQVIAGRQNTSGETHPNTLIAMSNLAGVYRDTKRFDDAANLYRKVLALQEGTFGADHPNTLVTLADFADVQRERGESEEARALFSRGLEATQRVLGATHPQTLKATFSLAELLVKQGRDADARDLHWQVLSSRLSVLPEHHPSVAESYGAIAKSLLNRGEPAEKAVFFFKKAVNALQGVRQNMAELDSATQRSFLDKHAESYLALQALLVDAGRFAEAEQVGRTLKDAEYTAFVRGARERPGGDPLGFSRLEREWNTQLTQWIETPNAIARQLAALRSKKSEIGELSALEQKQYADLDSAYGQAYERFFTLVTEWTSETQTFESKTVEREVEDLELEKSRAIQRLVGRIGPDVALLQAVAFKDGLHLFFITGEAFVHEEVAVSRSDLFETIFDARRVIDEGRDPGIAMSEFRAEELHEPLGKLYQWLIAPIEDELAAAQTKTLMLNLQGQIRYLPFAALWDGESYLTEKLELALYTPAANTRYDAPNELTGAQGFGLSKAVEGFSPLPGVPLELEYVIGTQDNPGVLRGEYRLDEGFTRTSLEEGLSSAAPVVHLATHFQIRPGDEASSFLLLGDGSRVSIAAINRSYKYDFDGVQLLTLSACETALGAENTGMEIEGFGALAQNKGAASVMASLWQVSDAAAPMLMRDFYRALVGGELTKAGALQNAQREMINSDEFKDPFYWAPFVLMGNWR